MGQRSKLHWPNVVCHPWAIVMYNVEPTLDQRRNAIWVEDKQVPLVCGPEVGNIYYVGAYFCFRMPDMRRNDQEVDELMGSNVLTIRETSVCSSEKKSTRKAAASAALHVKHVTAEVRRVELKHSSVSLESRGSKKRKS